MLLLFLLPWIRWAGFAPTTALSKEHHGTGALELVSCTRGGETMRYHFWGNSELKLLLNGMLVDHDLTSSPQAWIEVDSVPDKQIQMIDCIYWRSALLVSFKGWYFHLFCYPVLLLASHSEYVLQIISYSLPPLQPSPNLLCHLLYLILKAHPWLCALCQINTLENSKALTKYSAWSRFWHWNEFSAIQCKKKPLFLDWNLSRCCNYFKLFNADKAYGELGCLALFYLEKKLHNFSIFLNISVGLQFLVGLWVCLGLGFFHFFVGICISEKRNVLHIRKTLFFSLSFVAYYI